MADPTVQRFLIAAKAASLSEATLRHYTSKFVAIANLVDSPGNVEHALRFPNQTYAALKAKYAKGDCLKTYITPILSLFKHLPDLKVAYGAAFDKWTHYLERNAKVGAEQRADGSPTRQLCAYGRAPAPVRAGVGG
jgi:hypothetical protein